MSNFPIYVLRSLPKQTLTASGTRQQITTDNELYGTAIIITASKNNSGDIYIGSNDVTSNKCTPLGPDRSITFGLEREDGGQSSIPLDTIYFDGSNAGDVIYISYLDRG